MKILIADDDVTSRVVLAQVLKNLGHEVVAVEDGVAALDALRAPDAPGLAILDWVMPGLEGPEVVRQVRALGAERSPYLIILTSRSSKDSVIEGLEAGADDYLSKPFDVGELRARVEVGRRMIELQGKLIESRDTLSHQATHDALTGLPNRRAILDLLGRELDRTSRMEVVLAVGMCDIDHFKAVNDRYGHQTGDDVLRGFARVLGEHVRTYDAIGRIGGEEFLIILPMNTGADWEGAFSNLGRRISATPVPTRSGPLTVTASIGVVCAAANTTVDEILEAADQVMYQAKREGRNRVVFGPRVAGIIPAG